LARYLKKEVISKTHLPREAHQAKEKKNSRSTTPNWVQ